MRGGPYRLPGPGALLDRYRLPDLPTVPGSGRPIGEGGPDFKGPPYLGSPSPAAQANSPLPFLSWRTGEPSTTQRTPPGRSSGFVGR